MGDDRDEVRQGEGKALEALYRRYASWLRRALRRRFGSEAADDLVQDTYLKLAQSRQAERIEHPKALLYRIAVNTGVDQLRYSQRRSSGGLAMASTDPQEGAGQDELLILKEVVLGLPLILREVFILSRFAGLTYGEIAQRLGISVKTVEWRMSRAIALCMARLEER
ncbi:RNA polymerase sigma factor [Phenylobacterium sp.]|uniref:RNA polymerase sigma factor n=1 Tax=Phenylobacterium sp. TaxID=1871053 RepID=UPI00272FD849|nr:RNA polymerase sigma factor [Phenylobacterium sp.]MDP1875188.1 RNA polymerase sigma factor [Phenylobacterium sp.]